MIESTPPYSQPPSTTTDKADAAPSGVTSVIHELVKRSQPFHEPIHLQFGDEWYRVWTDSGKETNVYPDGVQVFPEGTSISDRTHGEGLIQILSPEHGRSVYITATGRIYGDKNQGWMDEPPLRGVDLTRAKSGLRIGTACADKDKGVFYATRSNKVIYLNSATGRLIFKKNLAKKGEVTATACLDNGWLVAGTHTGRLIWFDKKGHVLGSQKLAGRGHGERQVIKIVAISETAAAIVFSDRVTIARLNQPVDSWQTKSGLLLHKSPSEEALLLRCTDTTNEQAESLSIWRPGADLDHVVLDQSTTHNHFIACFGPSSTVIGGEVGQPLKVWDAQTGNCKGLLTDAYPCDDMQIIEPNWVVCSGGEGKIAKVNIVDGLVTVLTCPTGVSVSSFLLSSDGSLLIGGSDGGIYSP